MRHQTYPIGLDSDALLVLALKRISEKSNGEIHRRSQHPISEYDIFNKVVSVPIHWTYCDSVRKTGIEFDSVKFYTTPNVIKYRREHAKNIP